MNPFPLKIVTPDGLKYDGNVEELIVRSTTGDIGILAGHINCVVPLGMGQATLIIEGQKRYGACIGGMLSVIDGKVNLVPTTFEWADEIDKARSELSEQRARSVLNNKSAADTDIKLAEARLRRALVRQSVAGKK